MSEEQPRNSEPESSSESERLTSKQRKNRKKRVKEKLRRRERAGGSSNDDSPYPASDDPIAPEDVAPNASNTSLSAPHMDEGRQESSITEAQVGSSNADPHDQAPHLVSPIQRPPVSFEKKYLWPRHDDGSLVSIAEMRQQVHHFRQLCPTGTQWLSLLDGMCRYTRRCANTERRDMEIHLGNLNGLFEAGDNPLLEWPMTEDGHMSIPDVLNFLLDQELCLEEMGPNAVLNEEELACG
jgi:hypothetical protein